MSDAPVKMSDWVKLRSIVGDLALSQMQTQIAIRGLTIITQFRSSMPSEEVERRLEDLDKALDDAFETARKALRKLYGEEDE